MTNLKWYLLTMQAVCTGLRVGEIRDVLSRNVDVLEALGICRLAVFGSVLHGEATAESDLDMLVEFVPGRKPGLKFFEIQETLGRMLGIHVDLNTPGFLSRHFRDMVLGEAEVVYEQA
jgi:predicted nucleotidyltransferase